MAPSHASSQAGSNSRLLTCIAILLMILIGQIAWSSLNSATSLTAISGSASSSSSSTLRGDTFNTAAPLIKATKQFSTSYLDRKSPPSMPSVRITEAEEKALKPHETIYGGKGDKPHLGTSFSLPPSLLFFRLLPSPRPHLPQVASLKETRWVSQ
jgi:hypothetical protein